MLQLQIGHIQINTRTDVSGFPEVEAGTKQQLILLDYEEYLQGEKGLWLPCIGALNLQSKCGTQNRCNNQLGLQDEVVKMTGHQQCRL